MTAIPLETRVDEETDQSCAASMFPFGEYTRSRTDYTP